MITTTSATFYSTTHIKTINNALSIKSLQTHHVLVSNYQFNTDRLLNVLQGIPREGQIRQEKPLQRQLSALLQ